MIKKYKQYIKEELDHLEFDPYGEEDWDDDILNDLYEKVNKSNKKYIFFKKPVLIGHKSDNGKECYCNYYYRHVNSFYDEDYIHNIQC